MTAVPLQFRQGDSIIIRGEDNVCSFLRVKDRKASGWLLVPHGNGDPVTWSDEKLYIALRDRKLTHQPCNARNLSEAAGNAVEKTWDFWPRSVQVEARRRQVYCQRVAELLTEHRNAMDAYEEAAATVHSENFEEWKREDRDHAAGNEAIRLTGRARYAREERNLDELAPGPCRPSKGTVRRWFRTWDMNGRDIRLLIPLYHARGNSQPRYPAFPAEDGVEDTYKIMRKVIDDTYLVMPRRTKGAAWDEYVTLCGLKGIPAVSERTFRVFLHKEYDDRTEFQAHHGRKAAYLRFNVFERRKPPERPLAEVEVDHCLIDLVVTHPVTWKVLGRPWLTVIMDRATRVILGVHLSFLPPSFATLHRAVAHALWPKDLSGINGLVHDWPCFGCWDMLFTDNGKEFHSRSLEMAADVLGFTIIPLPAKQPWLKGMIERLWGTIGVQVFSLEEGATLSRMPDHYDPVKRARLSLDEVKAKLLKWIVDKYHHEKHRSLGCTPMQRWLERTAIYPVKPVPDFEHVIRLTGQILHRQIENIGVRNDGHLYSDRDPVTRLQGRVLSSLRARRGGRDRLWEIRVDPFDIGEIWILDDQSGQWFSLPNADPSISHGVSRHQHAVHKLIAKQAVESGQPVTVMDLEKAKRFAEEEVQRLFTEGASTGTLVRAARYAGDPGYFTRMPGPLAVIDRELPEMAYLGQPVTPLDLTQAVALLPAPVPAKLALPAPVPAPTLPAAPDFDALVNREMEDWK